jgi:hypothetical protein
MGAPRADLASHTPESVHLCVSLGAEDAIGMQPDRTMQRRRMSQWVIRGHVFPAPHTSNRTTWSRPSDLAREFAARMSPGFISIPIPFAPALPAASGTLRQRACITASGAVSALDRQKNWSRTDRTKHIRADLPSPQPMSRTQSTPCFTSASCINSPSISSGQWTSGHTVPACVPHPECLS